MEKLQLELFIKIDMIKEFILRFWSSKALVLFLIIFILLIFLRFYEIDTRSPFGWDQVDNAWASKNIIVNHELPLVGMVAKQNSGIFIGPIYYYMIAFFYWIFNLDPIASGVFAGVTSIFTFLTLFYITKKIFSVETAFIAIFINTVAYYGIIFDRVQWPVNFIPAISLIIFYSIYKIITGNPKFMLLLGLALGFSFHIHFTSIYFPFMIFLSVIFFPKTKETLKYMFFALPVFTVWLIPTIIATLENQQHTSNLLQYGTSYYHGFHVRRVLQLTNDALIQFEPFFTFSFLKPLKFVLVPLFMFLLFFKSVSKEKIVLCYLIILWFVVPWFVLSTYSGEISDYYFSTNRFIALIIISYLLSRIFLFRNWIPKFILSCFLIYYAIFNISKYFTYKEGGIHERSQKVLKAIEEGRDIGFHEGVPESYLYYYYMRKKGKEVY